MSRILLVDDDELIRLSMAEVLRARDYDVCTAINGKDAISQLKENDFDVVLLDIFMPEKDGFETIADIRRHDRLIKIIAMSGYTENSFHPLKYARSLGADDVLAKPFSADELISTLENTSKRKD